MLKEHAAQARVFWVFFNFCALTCGLPPPCKEKSKQAWSLLLPRSSVLCENIILMLVPLISAAKVRHNFIKLPYLCIDKQKG